ncbi:MAG: hypothetical protein ACFFA3_16870 [Promethearchaeota archaeon]
MNEKEEFNIDNYLQDANKKVKELELEKEQLNSKIKNFIISFQSFDSEINNSFIDAREFYSKKRDEYNSKLAELKRKRYEYERHWSDLTKKIENFPKPQLNENSLVLMDYTKKALEDIGNQLRVMNQKLEEQILGIDEENEIIEKIRKFESEKKEKMNNLAVLEKKQLIEIQRSDYYNTQKQIQKIENDLTYIYDDLLKFLNKRLMTHKKTLNLYKKAKKFEQIKKEIEEELIENKTTAEGYHQLFLKLMNLNQKVLLDELPNKLTSRARPKEIKRPDVRAILKRKKKYKKLEQKKLQVALEKQKAGKKLDFYEYQLILKHSKR